jgi:ethanolamine utilization protein EutA
MHDEDEIHSHDFDGEEGEDIEGLEMFRLLTVGIDIGSSTSHLVFARLTLRREGAALSSQFKVTEREVLFRSDIMLTPYVSGTRIDTDKVTEFIHDAYAKAGFTSDQIDTGAVVITGEALKKENAKPIIEFFAKDSGKFICASAGPNHEALLAAYGCGAVDLSKAEKTTVLNVDVGGGTSKLSLIRDGVVTQTAAIEIGARLIAFDDSGAITRIEGPGRRIMGHLGHTVALGQQFPEAEKEEFANLMTDLLFEAINGAPHSSLAQGLMLTEPISGAQDLEGVDSIVFSGGVSEYVYERDMTPRGDVGPLFGQAIRRRLAELPRQGLMREAKEGIRATVIGAGEYTVQASGTTSYISNKDVLPVFALKVVRPYLNGSVEVEAAIREALAKFDLPRFTSDLALAITLEGQQDYQSLRRLADGIAAAIGEPEEADSPLFLVLDMDVAKSLGSMLKEELGVPHQVIAIDGIDVGDLDYLDIGQPMGASEVIPVTVKSLMFPNQTE